MTADREAMLRALVELEVAPGFADDADWRHFRTLAAKDPAPNLITRAEARLTALEPLIAEWERAARREEREWIASAFDKPDPELAKYIREMPGGCRALDDASGTTAGRFARAGSAGLSDEGM